MKKQMRLIALLCCVVAAVIGNGKNTMNKKVSVSTKVFTLTSSAFTHNGSIPSKYTCDGQNISPALTWHNAPVGTQSFALIVDDPDAPKKVWVHWVLFNISAAASELPEDVQAGKFVSGSNDSNKDGQYGGPCPPSGVHHYHFTLYALDTRLNLLEQGASKEDVLKAIKGHVLGQATLIGLYQRKA